MGVVGHKHSLLGVVLTQEIIISDALFPPFFRKLVLCLTIFHAVDQVEAHCSDNKSRTQSIQRSLFSSMSHPAKTKQFVVDLRKPFFLFLDV